MLGDDVGDAVPPRDAMRKDAAVIDRMGVQDVRPPLFGQIAFEQAHSGRHPTFAVEIRDSREEINAVTRIGGNRAV